MTSLSVRLLQPACRAIGRQGTEKSGTDVTALCPLIGSKCTTSIEVFGRKWKGLLDTGSEVSIIPANVLLTAMEDGYDIDREVVEHPMDKSLRVCDASGKLMRFVAIVEVKVRESGEPAREVAAKMYVTRPMEDVLILGTNVLPALGYTLTKHVRCGDQGDGGNRSRDAKSTTGKQDRVAYVERRTYVAPGSVSWVRLKGCDQRKECLLISTHGMLRSGVCKVGADGVVEVPVLNGQEEPAVLRVGEAVGRWEEKEENWSEMDLLRVCPEEITDEPIEVRTRRGPRGRKKHVLVVRADGVEKELNREEQWKNRGEDRSKLVVIPEVLRALRRVRGLQDTKIFFYWSWRDLHPGNTALFGSCVKHVVLVLPPEDAGVGSWTAFADALGMWLAGGCHVYLVAGPRTGNDKSWFRVAEKARECVNMYIRPPCRTRIVDKLPTESEAADVKAPCFAMGIIADIDMAVSEHQAQVFYAGCAQQLAPWLTADQVFLLYRKGVTEQRKGNFSLALHCLQPLIPFFCNTPLIWVRIIEIGIRLLYYRDNVNEGRILDVYGSGRNRRVVLAPKSSLAHGRPSVAFYAQIADQAGITEDYLESIAGVLLSLTRNSANRKLRITSLSLAAYVALKMGRYNYAADLAHKMIDEEESIGNCSMTASMYLMECMVSTGPFDIALKVMSVEGTERQAGECGSYPIWAVINRCIVLCANRKYGEAEALYKEIRASTTSNDLYNRSVLALGVFIYSKLNRSADAFRLIDELRKVQDDEDKHVDEKGRPSAAEDPLTILARIEAEKRLTVV
ncbi:unnamed protein product [Heligmosomoides polygyrus]|uniref:Peptidase A2 domain-containing protein n=1 Tax=Heligmosomoides polygyrus TaxID=6339 RepID=A0A3P8B132_HELPZ|nr:unnamed protein product [Heligmosomoides polygyrus]